MTLNTAIGGADADSYGELADFETYATSMAWPLTGTEVAKEANLRRAAMFLDREYDWLGTRVSSTQARAWPRYVASTDKDGYAIASDTIPQAIIEAQFELAYLENRGNDLLAYVSGAAVKKTRVKVGPIDEETEYREDSGTEGRIRAVEGLVRQYLSGALPGSDSGSVRLVRG